MADQVINNGGTEYNEYQDDTLGRGQDNLSGGSGEVGDMDASRSGYAGPSDVNPTGPNYFTASDGETMVTDTTDGETAVNDGNYESMVNSNEPTVGEDVGYLNEVGTSDEDIA